MLMPTTKVQKPGNIGTGEHRFGEHRFGEHRYRGTQVPGNIGTGEHRYAPATTDDSHCQEARWYSRLFALISTFLMTQVKSNIIARKQYQGNH